MEISDDFAARLIMWKGFYFLCVQGQSSLVLQLRIALNSIELNFVEIFIPDKWTYTLQTHALHCSKLIMTYETSLVFHEV